MELLKTEYSKSKGNGKLDKVLLKCEEPNYYKLTEFLYTSQNEQALILKALYKSNINLVLKFGILESIEKEYAVSQELFELHNFIRYFCLIKCNDTQENKLDLFSGARRDDIKNIINNKNTISNYKMCHYGDNQIGILVMQEYNLKSIENYSWNENNFDILKNVIKQVVFSIIYAYETKGFIHGDLHSGNILLKPNGNNIINYGVTQLLILDLEAVIMDFEKSKLNQQNKINELVRNIDKLFTSIIYSNNMILDINYNRNKLISLKILSISSDFYIIIEQIIDDMTFDLI